MTAAVGEPGAGRLPDPVRRILVFLGVVAPSVLVGLFVAATSFPDTSMVPWKPNMVDLEVYRLAGQLLRTGGDPYALPGNLPFLYPPFAAWVAVPLSALPDTWVQVGWILANIVAVLAIMYRLGLTGWKLSLGAAAVIYFVEPVQQTFAFGQVGVFLVAFVLLDLAPGPRLSGSPRRLWPGWMTGVATAVKLTPGLFTVYLWVVGRRRDAIVSAVAFVAITVAAGIAAPTLSVRFWGRLMHGETGLGDSIIYFTNQSVMGTGLRVLGLGTVSKLVSLLISAALAVLGVVAAVRWHRRGEEVFALCLVGVATLLASPVSWSHHFVWVLPLGLALLTGPRLLWLQLLTLIWVGWVVGAPFLRLPNGGDLELGYRWSQNVLDSVTVVLGAVLLLAAALAATPRRQRANVEGASEPG